MKESKLKKILEDLLLALVLVLLFSWLSNGFRLILKDCLTLIIASQTLVLIVSSFRYFFWNQSLQVKKQRFMPLLAFSVGCILVGAFTHSALQNIELIQKGYQEARHEQVN